MRGEDYARELLDQAKDIGAIRSVGGRPSTPDQARLRRGISSAYYGVFHCLVDASTKMVVGRRPTGVQGAMRRALSRGYDHRTMAEACKSFGSGTLPVVMQAAVPRGTVPQIVQLVALAFLDLQGARHRADYNLQRDFSVHEAQQLAGSAIWAYLAIPTLPQIDAGRFFLAVLPNFTEIARHRD